MSDIDSGGGGGGGGAGAAGAAGAGGRHTHTHTHDDTYFPDQYDRARSYHDDLDDNRQSRIDYDRRPPPGRWADDDYGVYISSCICPLADARSSQETSFALALHILLSPASSLPFTAPTWTYRSS